MLIRAFSRSKSFLRMLIFKMPVFVPQSIFLVLWEILLLIILLFYLVYTPLKASYDFELDDHDIFLVVAYRIPVAIFAFDILVGFHTGYYELGRAVLQRKLIAEKYFKTKFFIDFICTLLMFLNSFVFNSTFLDIFNLILRIN